MPTKILTNGQTMHSLYDLLDPADRGEYVFDVDQDEGLTIESKETANVMSVVAGIEPDAFQAFSPDGGARTGVPMDSWWKLVRYARKGRGDRMGDAIRVQFDSNTIETTISRNGEDSDAVRESTLFCLDPDTVAGSNPDPPDLEYEGVATIDPDQAKATLASLGGSDTCFRVRLSDSGDAVVFAATDVDSDDDEPLSDDTVTFKGSLASLNDGEKAAEGSLISRNYVTDVCEAVVGADMERLTVRWGEDWPIRMEAEHPEWGLSAAYTIAPRLSSD